MSKDTFCKVAGLDTMHMVIGCIVKSVIWSILVGAQVGAQNCLYRLSSKTNLDIGFTVLGSTNLS